MADSASEPNVDDVLSSVRRLVSQELPRRATAQENPEPGALVLTSKDRIEADHTRRMAAKTLEQRIAELEAAVDKTAAEFEPDGSEDQRQHRPDRIVYTRPHSSETEVKSRTSTLRLSEIALIETGPAHEGDSTEEPPLEFRRGTPTRPVTTEAPMAEDVPTLPPVSAELHAFSDPDDVVARIEARIEQGGQAPVTVDPAPAPREENPTSDTSDDVDAQLTAAVRASIAFDAKAEAERVKTRPEPPLELKSAVAVSKPDPEPLPAADKSPLDTAQAAVLTERARALKKSATPEQTPPEAPVEVAAETQPDAQSEDTPAAHAEAALNALQDEEAMRLLVRRLVREELHGTLGEKITQSVRKLVQREVKRAIELRNLD